MLTRLCRRAARALSALAVLTLCCFRAGADGGVDFTRLAPAKAAFVVTIPDFSRLHAAFDGSELGTLWQEPGVQSFVTEMTADAGKRMADFLKELGAESKDLKPPTGAVGLAVYMPVGALPKAGKGTYTEPPSALFAADAGENAQSWKDLIERLVDRGVKDKELTTEEDSYAGVKIMVLKPIYVDPKDKPAPDAMKPELGSDEDDNGPLLPPQTGFAGFVGGSREHPQALHLAWNGTTFIAASQLKALEHALDATQGKDADSLASDADFNAAAAQHPADTQAAVYINMGQLLSQAFEQAIAARAGLEDAGATPDFGKLMSVMGLSQVRFVSFGIRLDTPDGLVDTSIGVLAPEKKGILKLIADPLGPFDPPGFVPPDAAAVSRFPFRFDKVYDLLREVATALPEAERQQFTAGLDQGVNLVKPGLDSLGPTVTIVGTFKQPLTHDSQMTLIVIDVKDQATVSNTLSFFAGQAQGLAESREFEGNTIYTVEAAQISVGLGFNRLFIGPPAAVENAMRLAGRAEAPKVSAESAFKDATRGFGPDGVVQSFSDMAQTLRWQYWTLQNMDSLAEAQIEEAGIDAEQREQILKRIRESRPKWMEKLPPLEAILAHLGDSAMEIRPTPDGFRGRGLILKPARK